MPRSFACVGFPPPAKPQRTRSRRSKPPGFEADPRRVVSETVSGSSAHGKQRAVNLRPPALYRDWQHPIGHRPNPGPIRSAAASSVP
jgi:hypothetical protein